MGNRVISVNDEVLMRRDRSERTENHGKHISINLFEMGRIWDSWWKLCTLVSFNRLGQAIANSIILSHDGPLSAMRTATTWSSSLFRQQAVYDHDHLGFQIPAGQVKVRTQKHVIWINGWSMIRICYYLDLLARFKYWPWPAAVEVGKFISSTIDSDHMACTAMYIPASVQTLYLFKQTWSSAVLDIRLRGG